MVQISVVIVSYNARSFLRLCLESVRAASKALSVEVILVDNASADGAPEMVEKEFPEVRLIANRQNLGFSKANNQGARWATGKYLLILNPDVILPEDCLTRLWRFAEDREDVGAVGLRYIDGAGNFLPESKRNFPSRRVALSKLFGEGKGYYAKRLGPFETGTVDILAGAFLLVPRSVYVALGGFDEDFFMFGEDIDLCYRIAQSGRKNYYKGDQTILHFKGESSVKDRAYYRNFYGAMNIFHNKIYGDGVIWNLFLSSLTGIMSAVSALRSRPHRTRVSRKGNLLYIGNRTVVAERLMNQFPDALLISSAQVPTDWTGVEEVFYDSHSLSFKEIVASMSKLGSASLRKRIISKKGDCALGSDVSTRKGEVIKL